MNANPHEQKWFHSIMLYWTKLFVSSEEFIAGK